MEDTWKTKNYIHRQFAGILGFVFTNSYLAISYFNNDGNKIKGVQGKHISFKMKLANQLVVFKNHPQRIPRYSMKLP